MFIITNNGQIYNTEYILKFETANKAIYAFMYKNKYTAPTFSNVVLLETYSTEKEFQIAYNSLISALSNNACTFKFPISSRINNTENNS